MQLIDSIVSAPAVPAVRSALSDRMVTAVDEGPSRRLNGT